MGAINLKKEKEKKKKIRKFDFQMWKYTGRTVVLQAVVIAQISSLNLGLHLYTYN